MSSSANNARLDPNWEILIVGLGLLGGSYAEKLSKSGYKVTGIDSNPESIEFAAAKHWIQESAAPGTPNASNLTAAADLIIICLPPQNVISFFHQNLLYFRKNQIITDVTGVKSRLIPEIEALLKNTGAEFIAGHPMAGKEVGGIINANAKILENANFIMVPTFQTSKIAQDTLYQLANVLNFGKTSLLTPEEHDQIIAYVSQLTHLIAVSLMNANRNSNIQNYTGDSFKELTRIAKIDPNLWVELFLFNKDFLLSEIDKFENELKKIKNAINDENPEKLSKILEASTAARLEFEK